jgi:small subunit ribosomal protein S18
MARDRRSTKSAAADRRRPQKKKVSILNTEGVTYIDYKDVNLLRRFMSERAKIRARRVTGNSTQQQREVARAIRVAREMALLPYSVRQVTQRKGSRRDRDRDDRELRGEDVTSRPPAAPDGVDYESGPAEGESLDEVVVAVDDGGEPVAVAEVVLDDAGEEDA